MSKGITLFCRLKQLYKMVSLSATGTVVLLTSQFFSHTVNHQSKWKYQDLAPALRLADLEVSVLLHNLVKTSSLFLNCYCFVSWLFVYCNFCNKMHQNPSFRKVWFQVSLKWKENCVPYYIKKLACHLTQLTQVSVIRL